MTALLQEARALAGTIVKHRRYLHENAEVSDELPITTAYVKRQLKEVGYQPIEISKSSIVATVGKRPGKTILLRADMDGLPVTEETGLDYACKTGNMHGCGHDMHTAMLLGAAKLLKDHEHELEGQVKLMFQPGEETLVGAKAMIEAGVLENPKVDAAFMLHVTTSLPVSTGTIVIPLGGFLSASSDWYTVAVQGKGGHGALPNDSIDPLNILSHIHLALQAINAREVPSGDNVVLTVGQMHGGNTSNVIPDSAFLSGTIRAFSKESRSFIKQRLEEISKGIAATFRGSAEVQFEHSCPNLMVDKDLREQIAQSAIGAFNEEAVKTMEEAFGIPQLAGAEDFAFVCERVPGVMALLGAGSKEEGYAYPSHHPKADYNEDTLPIGAALYANTAMEWLKQNQ